MNNNIIFAITFIALFLAILWLAMCKNLLCDQSNANKNVTTDKNPFSFARVQLAWWTFIILTSFITIFWITGYAPDLNNSTIILLGIGALTTASARLIDISDQDAYNTAKAKAAIPPPAGQSPSPSPDTLSRDQPRQDFFTDILSDKNGISIHRLQAVIFNTVFGIWFIYTVVKGINGPLIYANTKHLTEVSKIIPLITQNNLILLGVSSGTYIALKTTENK